MNLSKIPWARVAIVAAELVLVGVAVVFPLVITDATLQTLLRILELAAGFPLGN
jgi:hypothetical protein